MTFIAETLARQGHNVNVITVQLSWLSKISGASRYRAIAQEKFNVWVDRAERLRSFVWLPIIHPVSGGGKIGRTTWPILAWLYPRLLPRAILRASVDADLIIIESSVAIILFPALKKMARKAKFIYCASDRLDVVGMPIELGRTLDYTASSYDLIRVPAPDMRGDFPPPCRVALLPHGLQRGAFDRIEHSPYPSGTRNAVVAGDMSSDLAAINRLIANFPDVYFHLFGKLDEAAVPPSKNVVHHGEVGFDILAGYIKYADVGLAPYAPRHRSEYLAQSSLKLLQYTYCRLPIVAPAFVKGERHNIQAYVPGDDVTLVDAMGRALTFDRSTIASDDIRSWEDVCSDMLSRI